MINIIEKWIRIYKTQDNMNDIEKFVPDNLLPCSDINDINDINDLKRRMCSSCDITYCSVRISKFGYIS